LARTAVNEANRWFGVVDVKMRAEELLRRSGIPFTVFCPTWVMEVLPKFIKRDKAFVIKGKHAPGIHFFAAADFGRMLAKAYEDDKALDKRLFVHGPESITLHDALETFVTRCLRQVKLVQLRLWQAQLFSMVARQMDPVTRLIHFFDRVGELGDPNEANALLGPPTTSLDEWIGARIGKSAAVR
jgi:uncharacterized protein YbjT (DUF2867 family)